MPTIEEIRLAFIDAKLKPLIVYDHTKLQPAWQSAFKSGTVRNPQYSKVVKLVEYLQSVGITI